MNNLPPPAVMYKALVDRDTTFEGIFYAGVRTTGIFCRPTCPARKPKAANIEYFATGKEALLAGYRPCQRCHPLDRDKPAPELVRRLCAIVEQTPLEKISESRLRSMGVDPSTARRQFQRYFGLTFQAYCRMRRIGSALHEIRNGESVIGAQIDHGFESASGFYEAFKQIFGAPPSKAEQVACLFARWIDTPLGAMLALADDDGLHLLEFVDRRGLENEILALRKRRRCFIVPGANRYLDTIAKELAAYFDGSGARFTVPLVPTGSAFEQTVWKLLQMIPPGKTRSYADMARTLGNPNATRAVGRAIGRNPLAIVIPCHRVIRSDGSLCGYGGGVWRKQWLLDHERRMMQPKGRARAGR